jgi:hypothetical protein
MAHGADDQDVVDGGEGLRDVAGHHDGGVVQDRDAP